MPFHFLLLLIVACGGDPSPLPKEIFKPPDPPKSFSTTEAIQQFEGVAEVGYRLGDGDVITIQIWDRADLSGAQTIGPDGAITLPVAGTLRVAGMTRDEAAKAVKGALAKFFTNITATVRVDQYVSNRLMVLGRVKTPGIHRFETVPTLLEILSRAGGLSIDAGQMNPTHCAIVRGREGVAWLDLKRMMENGDLTLNLRLKPNDLIFIPEWSEQPIYVLGEVQRPGLYRRTPGMTLLDALALAGGTTRDSDPSEMHLVRPARNQNVVIDLEEILKPNPSMNVALEGGDILYVPTNGLADYGYVMEKLNISSWIFVGTTAVSTRAAAINSRNR